MNIRLTKDLIEKAKTRKDGVYSFKGYLWVVKDGQFVAFADYYGNCFMRAGSFNISVGTVDYFERRKCLTEWLKSTK